MTHELLAADTTAQQMRAHIGQMYNSSMWDDSWPALDIKGTLNGSELRPRAATVLTMLVDGETLAEGLNSPSAVTESKESEGDVDAAGVPHEPATSEAAVALPITGPPPSELEAQRLEQAIQSELDALPGRAEQAKDQISVLEKQVG